MGKKIRKKTRYKKKNGKKDYEMTKNVKHKIK